MTLLWQLAVALAVADLFGEQTGLDTLTQRNSAGTLAGEEVERFRTLVESSAYVSAFAATAYLLQMLPEEGESASDVAEPDFLFDTPQDALKGLVAALNAAIEGAPLTAFGFQALQLLVSMPPHSPPPPFPFLPPLPPSIHPPISLALSPLH